MKKIKELSFLFPPALAAVVPIFSFYLSNITELSLKFMAQPLLFSIMAGIVGALILSFLTKNKDKAALLAFLPIMIFFSYGHISKSLNKLIFIQLPNGVVIGPDKILLPTLAIFFVLINFIVLKTLTTPFWCALETIKIRAVVLKIVTIVIP